VTNKKFRVGLIGLGMAVQPHARSLADLADRVEVAGGFSPSAQRRAAFAERTGFPVVSTMDVLLDDRSVDAIMLLTPPMTHLDLIRRCAAAGKHVLLEKPVEGTLARSVELVEVMERAGLRLGIVFQHRFRPVAQRLRAVVEGGRLGGLLSASVQVRWWRPASYFAQPGRGMKARDGGGVLLSQAIHTLDVFGTLTGPVSEASCFAQTSPLRQIDTEDIVAGMLRFANGAIGTIGATTVAYPGFAERIELSGDKGTATIEGNRLVVQLQDGTEDVLEGDGQTGGGSDPMAFDHGPHRSLLADFLSAVEEGRDSYSSGRSALAVHRLIDALLRSSAEGRIVKVG
jgi:predicted dehydrogenase